MKTSLISIKNAAISLGAQTPAVRRIWLFGSMAKGTARPGSDADIAIELDEHSLSGESAEVFWHFESSTLRESLSMVLECEVDLQLLDVKSTPHIVNYLSDASILLYEKGSKP